MCSLPGSDLCRQRRARAPAPARQPSPAASDRWPTARPPPLLSRPPQRPSARLQTRRPSPKTRPIRLQQTLPPPRTSPSRPRAYAVAWAPFCGLAVVATDNGRPQQTGARTPCPDLLITCASTRRLRVPRLGWRIVSSPSTVWKPLATSFSPIHRLPPHLASLLPDSF